MKKIGIIGGMSHESTIEYYKIICREYKKIAGGINSPYIVIDSLNLQEISNYMENAQWDKVLDVLIDSAQNLIAAGAEILIIATNTPHMVFDQLKEQIEKPIISIMEATAKAIKNEQLEKVSLLGTKFTMQNDFYQKTLQKYSIDVIVPSKKDQEIINEIIWTELVNHELKKDSKEKYLAVIKKLQEKGAEGVILGCTEIPLLISQKDCEIPTFNTTKIHALSVLKYAITNE